MSALAAVLVALSLPIAAQAGTGQPAASVATGLKSPAASNTKCATSGSTQRCVRVQSVPLSKLTPAQRTERAKVVGARLGAANAHRRASATGAAVTIIPPGQCNFAPLGGGVTVYTANPDRFTSCADTYWTVTNTVTTDGVTTVSTFNFEDLQWASYSATSSTWAHGMATIGYEGGTNALADGFSGLLNSNCDIISVVCTAANVISPDPQAVDITPGSVSYFEWAESDAGPSATTANSLNYLDFTLGVVWTITSIDPPVQAIDVPYGQVGGPTTGLVGRCDTIAASTDGCVNEDFTPTLAYDSTPNANPLVAPVAQHIYTAQNGGLTTAWGVPQTVKSNGAPLFRDMNQADINANRSAACKNLPVPAGDQCDEYPLASTYEGAAFNSDFSAFAVPASANSSQGGITSNFYSGNRVIDSDPFYVRAILQNGTASW